MKLKSTVVCKRLQARTPAVSPELATRTALNRMRAWNGMDRRGEQVVAADAFDRLVSVFDGATEYHMGKAHLAKRGASQWAPMETCYFVYRTKEQVR